MIRKRLCLSRVNLAPVLLTSCGTAPPSVITILAAVMLVMSFSSLFGNLVKSRERDWVLDHRKTMDHVSDDRLKDKLKRRQERIQARILAELKELQSIKAGENDSPPESEVMP